MFKTINYLNLLLLLCLFQYSSNEDEVFEFDHELYYKIPSYYGSRATGYFFLHFV